MTIKTKTRCELFEARAEQVMKVASGEGPKAGRMTLAIREGLLASGRHSGDRGRGGLLGSVIHCINLVKIHAEVEDEHGRRYSAMKIEETSEPEAILVYLASAAVELEQLIDAIAAELDAADLDNSRRNRRAA